MKTETIKTVFLYCLLLIVISSLSTQSHSLQQQPNIVNTLPGYPGVLPFTLETGYIGVGESEEIQLFYYFIESERNVDRDPLMLWLTGGPGCSALSGLIFEIGPVAFNLTASDTESGAHKLQYNPYAWTKVASIIFVDSPVGTGFSYATNPEAYYSSDTLQSAHIDDFLRKWIIEHPKFAKSSLYVAGDSYSGMVVPIVVQDMLQGNNIGLSPTLNLKGYVLGNAITNLFDYDNSRYEYAYRISLLSDDLYKSAVINCNNNFINMNDKNTKCSKNVQAMVQDLKVISDAHVLEHRCLYVSPKPSKQLSSYTDSLLPEREFCRAQHYMFLYSWANDKEVRKALNIREGSIGHWERCNKTLAYEHNTFDVTDYHLNNSKYSLQVLAYNGDQDICVSYVDTLKWIEKLKIPISDEWRPWFVDGQVSGYTTEYSNLPYRLVHATVKSSSWLPVFKIVAVFMGFHFLTLCFTLPGSGSYGSRIQASRVSSYDGPVVFVRSTVILSRKCYVNRITEPMFISLNTIPNFKVIV